MLLTNLRVFLKFLGRNKVYSLVTVLGFSVSLMFVIVLGLFVKQELTFDNFHEKGDRIVAFLARADWGKWIVENYPEVESYSRGHYPASTYVILPDGEYISAKVSCVDSVFFDMFSFPLVEGSPRQVLSKKNAAVVSQSFAARVFGDVDPVGQPLHYEEKDYEVTGIFADFPVNRTQFGTPDIISRFDTAYEGTPPTHYGSIFYVLQKEGADIMAKTDRIEHDLTEAFPWIKKHADWFEVKILSLQDSYFEYFTPGSSSLRGKAKVLLYLGIALLILVVALLNYINMTVAQSAFRAREVALKKLHGASRGMIIAQLLVESLTVTVISTGIGLVLAFLAEPYFNNMLSTTLNLSNEFTLPAISVMSGMVALLAVISGIIPAMMMSRFKPIEIIKGTFSRRVKGVYSKVLSVFQYTVSIALLICSAFIIMQSRHLATRDIGLERDGIMLIQNVIEAGDTERRAAMKSLLSDIPGVEAVSLMVRNPYNSMGGNTGLEYNGQQVSVEMFKADSSFLGLFGVTVDPADIDSGGGEVAYLNRAAWNTFQPETTGNMLELGLHDGDYSLNIGGVMSDFNFHPLNIREPCPFILLVTDEQTGYGMPAIAVKISKGNNLQAVADKVVAAYEDFVGNDRFVWEWGDDVVRSFYEQERRTSMVMGSFTVLVIIIMLMGIFAMSVYVLRQKEKEIAIRKVNGSTIGEILVLLGRQSLASVAVAFVVACPVAWFAIKRWLDGFPYRIEMSWWVFAAAGLAVWLLSLICVLWQSYRAATANPVKSLKSE